MTKSSDGQIDQDEIKVLSILEQNAKENISTIAKKCGFSRQKTCRIIDNLEKNGRIWGYTAIPDEAVFGFHHYILLLKKSNVPIDDSHRDEIVFEKVDKYLPGLVKVDDIYYTNGMFDLVITFYARDLLDAKRFSQAVFTHNLKIFKEHIILDTIFPIRKKSFKNPKIKNLVNYL
jgi:DNA-binding Lrp family transcriptional regulator